MRNKTAVILAALAITAGTAGTAAAVVVLPDAATSSPSQAPLHSPRVTNPASGVLLASATEIGHDWTAAPSDSLTVVTAGHNRTSQPVTIDDTGVAWK